MCLLTCGYGECFDIDDDVCQAYVHAYPRYLYQPSFIIYQLYTSCINMIYILFQYLIMFLQRFWKKINAKLNLRIITGRHLLLLSNRNSALSSIQSVQD